MTLVCFCPLQRIFGSLIRQTCSKGRDFAKVYELKIKAASTKQGSRFVTECANLLKGLWQELDHYRCIEMKCSEDAATLKNFIEKDPMHEFLAGLNAKFDEVRVKILGKEDQPSLNEVISIIMAEESRREVMLESQIIDGSAMITNGANNRSSELDQHLNNGSGKAEFLKTSGGDN